MRLVHSEDDFGVVVGSCIGPLLPRKRKSDAAVLAPRLKTPDALTPRMRYLHTRPLAPEVKAARRLKRLRDVRAADPGRDFEEVELAVVRPAYELRVRRAALKP